jgi:hypothetical protein
MFVVKFKKEKEQYYEKPLTKTYNAALQYNITL